MVWALELQVSSWRVFVPLLQHCQKMKKKKHFSTVALFKADAFKAVLGWKLIRSEWRYSMSVGGAAGWNLLSEADTRRHTERRWAGRGDPVILQGRGGFTGLDYIHEEVKLETCERNKKREQNRLGIAGIFFHWFWHRFAPFALQTGKDT